MSARLQLAVAAAAPLAAEEFRWPAPSYFEFVREQDRFDWANCLLTFRDGTKASGRMRSFVPDEAMLQFRPDASSETIGVEFSDLLQLQLRRPVELRREGAGAAVHEAGTPWRSETQPFRIDLENGEIFQGVTLGYVSALCGLFLYLPQEDGGIVRCFVPAHAARICSIDAHIGQILINQGAASPEAVGAALDLQANMRMQDFDQFLARNALPAEARGNAAAHGGERRRPQSVSDTQRVRRSAKDENDRAVMAKLRAMTQMRMAGDAALTGESDNSFIRRYASAINAPYAPAAPAPRKSAGGGAPQARNEIGVQELVSRLAAESGDRDVTEQQAVKSDSALVMLVNRIILDAVQRKASDIHIEANPGPKSTRVRFREDGVLVNYLDLPSQFRNAMVSRIKIMSQLDITERRKPQDGKIDFSRFGPAQVELRVATVPTTGGLEDVVMRVLVAGNPVPLGELGLDQSTLRSLKSLICKPHGLFLVCGPTGSGKTTTLHSLLAYLNTFERKIWTAEDPIEITQPGLRQVQVNAKIGWTFAAAMRSFMRADPDVIMVGEMRDGETAKIGIEASLTGHLVLSTLHTNSAAESIVRLLDLGMDSFNFADALLGVLAQRLIKRLCPDCKSAYTPTPDELEQLSLEFCSGTQIDPDKQMQQWIERFGGDHGAITLFRAHGCEHCAHSGYRGRLGLHELLVSDQATKRLVQARAPVEEIKNAAAIAGRRTLRQDGIEKVLQGLTEIRQVKAVCS